MFTSPGVRTRNLFMWNNKIVFLHTTVPSIVCTVKGILFLFKASSRVYQILGLQNRSCTNCTFNILSWLSRCTLYMYVCDNRDTFVRVSTHKTEMYEDVWSELIPFIYVCLHQHLFYINPIQTIFDILWLIFTAVTNFRVFTEKKRDSQHHQKNYSCLLLLTSTHILT